MPKLSKNMYVTSKGEKKLNCYHVPIKKETVAKTNIQEQDELNIYAENNKIVIEKSEK